MVSSRSFVACITKRESVITSVGPTVPPGGDSSAITRAASTALGPRSGGERGCAETAALGGGGCDSAAALGGGGVAVGATCAVAVSPLVGAIGALAVSPKMAWNL
jgi:hypothetical protein